ncbi:MAG TPA: MBL fold metallo-hydrolase [Streptosporangiaceae bacterium]|jgi:glyoxylase-like metal-dependent hydrolase (beta-lactamase superfamily II)/rhodanese-related sulfurtransferase|nr:MBL fold metallo-hydrolase [Streptosporangiaceae bacterium]
MVEVLPIETPALGDRSYLVHDGDSALVIDPQRDIDRVIELAAQAGARITCVAETHLHNDYVTGGLALAREAGADYLVNGDDPVSFGRTPVADGDRVDISKGMSIRVLATPGHTFSHLAYVVEAGGEVAGVFTGGSLLFGATGRTDLLGPASTTALTRAQWASARRLARDLPDAAPVFPTHGFGSFCAASQSPAAQALTSSTIGQEKLANPALTLDEPSFVESLLAGLDAWPTYYAHMAPVNLAGPAGPDLSPPRPASPAAIRRRLDAGEWVIDLRGRVAFAASHVAGTFSFPLENSFATYLGWLIPWGTPLTLLGESASQVAQAQRELVRIGIDRPAAAATGGPGDWAGPGGLASLRLVKFGDLAAAMAAPAGKLVVLDVRRRLERADSHIPGTVHIPLHELPGRLDEVPPGEVWVHCGGGYRSTVAASMLAAHGRDVVAVDDDFAHAGPAGLPLAGA